MSDLADRVFQAVDLAVMDVRDSYPRTHLDAPTAEVAAVAAVALLRELDRVYHERDSSFEHMDLAVLADEIEGKDL